MESIYKYLLLSIDIFNDPADVISKYDNVAFGGEEDCDDEEYSIFPIAINLIHSLYHFRFLHHE